MYKIGFIVLAILALLCAGIAQAGVTGKISGRVLALDGENPLVGANVIVEGTSLGASTDLDGYYFLINVPPGVHEVTASFMGFRPITKSRVFVQVDHTTELEFRLESTTLEAAETVIVIAEQQEIQRDVTSTRVNISSEEIGDLPVNNVTDILRLQTGVVATGENRNNLHVRGGRTGELAYLVDGHRMEDPLFGGSGTDVNTAAIEQMELLTGTFNAEYGNAMSGVVNIVTKENVEEYHGRISYKSTALGLESYSDNLDEGYADGYVSGPLPFVDNAGFLLSGKIKNSGDYYQSGSGFTTDANNDVWPSGEGSGEPFGYDNLDSFFGKVHFQPFKGSKLALSLNYDDRNWQNYVHSYKYIPDSAYVRFSNSRLIAASFTHSPSERWFYEARLSYYDYNYWKNYGSHNYNEYTLTSGDRDSNGEFRLDDSNEEYISEEIKTYTAKFDATYQYNRFHQFKSGAELKLHDIEYFYIYGPHRPPESQYINDYHFELDLLGGSPFNDVPHEGAVYLQDKIEFSSLVLNLGLRYDYYHPNVSYIADPNDPEGSVKTATVKQQLSPRLGIAYPVSDRMVFHLSYGHFFQRPTFEVLYEDFSRNMNVNKPLIGDPDLEPQRTQSYELGVNAMVSQNLQLQATVFSKKINNLIGVAWHFWELYEPLQYSYYTNEDFAYIKGFEINFKYRLDRFSSGINYTYSIAEGSSSSQMERYEGSYHAKGTQSLQFYPLDFDQRHMVNTYLDVSFGKSQGPFGFAPKVFQNTYFSLVFQFGSGLPFTYNPDVKSRYEPDLNNDRMPMTYTFDLEAEKRFYFGRYNIGVLMEVYNLFNTENVRTVYTATGEPDDSGEENESLEWMQVPTYYYPPRVIYMGLSFGF